MPALTLNADQLRAHFEQWGIPGSADVLLPDRAYACPTADWVAGQFARNVAVYLAATIGNFENEDADCDDFAEECSCYAHRCHRKTLARPRETSLAFGEFWYTDDERGPHAINAFVALQTDSWHLYFFEPQTCELVELSQPEISSCVLLRF